MDLLQLEHFLAVVEERTFTRAAERVCRTQPAVSQHLKILKESGLIQGEVDGPKVCYCIDPARLKELKTLIASL